MTNSKSNNVRHPGAPLGNQNAVKAEAERVKKVTIQLYAEERALVKAIAQKLEISGNEAHRQAIRLLADTLGIGVSNDK